MDDLGFTQNDLEFILTCFSKSYLGITQDHLGFTQITQDVLRNYLGITQELLRNYLGITQDDLEFLRIDLGYLGITQE